jgi:PAS domain S-box-containing protein
LPYSTSFYHNCRTGLSFETACEEAFRESEERYRTLFTNMTEAFLLGEVICNNDGKPCDYICLDANPAYELNTGVKKERILGRSVLELFPDASLIAIKKYGEVALSGQPTNFEFFSQALNRYLDAYVFSPEQGRFAVVFTDVTERKRIEEALRESEIKYRNIVETANEGIWVSDAEARTTFVNKKMAEMLGYSPEEIIGRLGVDFADEEKKTYFKQRIEKRRQGIDEVHENRFVRKDGSFLWLLVNSKSLFDTDGKFTGVLSMLTDITERKQEEQRILRYNRIFEGINQICSNVVQAKTEEELANSCLTVALEVTGSQFGFVNLLGEDGLLHDTAISEVGWNQCLMYDKTGHRRPSGDFIMHGLYGLWSKI